MQGKCSIKNVLFKCIVSTPNRAQRVYMGLSENEWKKRFYNHSKSFQNKNCQNETNITWKLSLQN